MRHVLLAVGIPRIGNTYALWLADRTAWNSPAVSQLSNAEPSSHRASAKRGAHVFVPIELSGSPC
jgi:hypothetical protein